MDSGFSTISEEILFLKGVMRGYYIGKRNLSLNVNSIMSKIKTLEKNKEAEAQQAETQQPETTSQSEQNDEMNLEVTEKNVLKLEQDKEKFFEEYKKNLNLYDVIKRKANTYRHINVNKLNNILKSYLSKIEEYKQKIDNIENFMKDNNVDDKKIVWGLLKHSKSIIKFIDTNHIKYRDDPLVFKSIILTMYKKNYNVIDMEGSFLNIKKILDLHFSMSKNDSFDNYNFYLEDDELKIKRVKEVPQEKQLPNIQEDKNPQADLPEESEEELPEESEEEVAEEYKEEELPEESEEEVVEESKEEELPEESEEEVVEESEQEEELPEESEEEVVEESEQEEELPEESEEEVVEESEQEEELPEESEEEEVVEESEEEVVEESEQEEELPEESEEEEVVEESEQEEVVEESGEEVQEGDEEYTDEEYTEEEVEEGEDEEYTEEEVEEGEDEEYTEEEVEEGEDEEYTEEDEVVEETKPESKDRTVVLSNEKYKKNSNLIDQLLNKK